MAKQAERQYKKFLNNHPYLEKAGELTGSALHPDKSFSSELEKILEPRVRGFEDLGYALDQNYQGKTLDSSQEDQYYDR